MRLLIIEKINTLLKEFFSSFYNYLESNKTYKYSLGQNKKFVIFSTHTGSYSGQYGKVESKFQGMPSQDNKSDQVAYRNCTCGHHYNYHDA